MKVTIEVEVENLNRLNQAFFGNGSVHVCTNKLRLIKEITELGHTTYVDHRYPTLSEVIKVVNSHMR